MNTVYANIINETEKLLLKKKTIAILILSAAVPIISAILISLFQNSAGITPFSANSFPITILGLFTSLFLPLFICMAACDSFAGEYSDKTMKITLTQPASRFKVYCTKAISIGIYTAISLGVIFISSILSSPILSGKYGLLSGLLKDITAYSAAFMPMFLFGIASILIAQFFKSSSGALVISVFIYIASKIISTVFPNISGLLFTSYSNWHLLWLGGSVSYFQVLNIFLFMVAYSIIFLAWGFYLFDKKEL
jgi:ABC-2 type transport system permease protein